MKAKVVVGLGFGDEGKGVTTDFLSRRYKNSIVVRYCGGHQAGHTVMKGDIKHVFSSYGSGTLNGAPTYISEHCCFYPPYMERELVALSGKCQHTPEITLHPLTKLTTPYDIALNRIREMRLNHGSVGLGIGTTMQRSSGPYKLHAVDMRNIVVLQEKLKQIERYYESEYLYQYNNKERRYYNEVVDFELKFFLPSVQRMETCTQICPYRFLEKFETVIFEGAQGILLDMDFGIFPNVTYGHTSSKNAISICKELGIRDIAMYYVTRCYTTRHGNGWMPPSSTPQLININEEINVANEWQGNLRISELDYNLLRYALLCDDTYSSGCEKNLVVTCLDQRPDFEFRPDKLQTKIHRILGSNSPDSKGFTLLTFS